MAVFRGVLRKAVMVLACAGGMYHAPMASAQSLSGGYLAGKQALFSGDFAEAAKYIERVLDYDPGNIILLERAVIVYLSMGDVDRAAQMADLMDAQGTISSIAQIAQTVRDIKSENYAAVLQSVTDGGGVGPYADDLTAAWARLGQGDMSDALVSFDDAMSKDTVRIFVPFHKAMALASVGDYQSASEIFDGETPGSLTYSRRGLLAWAEVLSQLGQNGKALQLLNDHLNGATDPELNYVKTQLESGATLPFDTIRSPRDGIAEVFYEIADVFSGRDQDDLMLIYAQMASYLREDFTASHLLAGRFLENMGQYDLALETYDRIPSDDLSFHSAELGRVSAFSEMGQLEDAQALLDGLAQTHSDLPVVHYTRGDLLRRNQEFEECAAAYTQALDLYDSDQEQFWFLYYTRAICYERSGQWDAAESDFRKALELSPEQPQVLNYLGYSLVIQGEKLDEAVDMIERALAVSPNSGAITDSMGWALFTLGRYEEAVAPMERAAEILSVDPVINDHLGDVYWAVGRKLEAEFMWRRALSFVDWEGASEEVDADRLRRKLEIGLDDVLAEEGADPLKAAPVPSSN